MHGCESNAAARRSVGSASAELLIQSPQAASDERPKHKTPRLKFEVLIVSPTFGAHPSKGSFTSAGKIKVTHWDALITLIQETPRPSTSR